MLPSHVSQDTLYIVSILVFSYGEDQLIITFSLLSSSFSLFLHKHYVIHDPRTVSLTSMHVENFFELWFHQQKQEPWFQFASNNKPFCEHIKPFIPSLGGFEFMQAVVSIYLL